SAFLVRRIGSGQLSPRVSSSWSCGCIFSGVKYSAANLTRSGWAIIARMPAENDRWLALIASLPTEDPAARMRVLRTLESLGAAVVREGAYLLPDTESSRKGLEALADYIAKG